MTKKQTDILREYLGICGRLWRWIGKNIRADELVPVVKDCWPEWERNGGTIPSMTANCPCCEFADRVMDKGCSICPLEWTGGGTCRKLDAEYSQACFARTRRSKRMWANRIARLAEEALARLEA